MEMDTFYELEKKIEKALASNATSFETKKGVIKLYIQASGIGNRYQAVIMTPTYTTMVETPDTVDTEDGLTFYKRLAYELVLLIRELNQ
jgi:hypothetical protein